MTVHTTSISTTKANDKANEIATPAESSVDEKLSRETGLRLYALILFDNTKSTPTPVANAMAISAPRGMPINPRDFVNHAMTSNQNAKMSERAGSVTSVSKVNIASIQAALGSERHERRRFIA